MFGYTATEVVILRNIKVPRKLCKRLFKKFDILTFQRLLKLTFEKVVSCIVNLVERIAVRLLTFKKLKKVISRVIQIALRWREAQ